MTDTERARKVFGKTPFAAETGCRIEEAKEGYALCSLEVQARHHNALGLPMGGAVFTLADYAFGIASNFDRDVFLSTGADVHFLRAAKGSVLYAEAKEVRSGRRTCLYTVEVRDELGTDVAYMTFSGCLYRTRKQTVSG